MSLTPCWRSPSFGPQLSRMYWVKARCVSSGQAGTAASASATASAPGATVRGTHDKESLIVPCILQEPPPQTGAFTVKRGEIPVNSLASAQAARSDCPQEQLRTENSMEA